jgi:hypothetical protein
MTGCAGQTAAPVTGAVPLSSSAPVTSAAPTSSAGPDNLVPDGYTGCFRIAATVLENQHHGPQLCVTVTALTTASLPPQCGGLALSGWTWTGLNPESRLGTTWGSYVVTGTFDGSVFKLSQPATVSRGNVGPQRHVPDFTSPCPLPVGGWRPVNLAKATDHALQAANSMVTADPDFAGLWIDQKMPPADPNRGGVMSDPTKLVLNVRFTKNPARHEADIRKVWGGASCLSQAKHSLKELDQVQNQLTPGPGVLYTEIDVVTGTVEVGMLAATQQHQRELDVKYGPGLVHLIGVLEPID